MCTCAFERETLPIINRKRLRISLVQACFRGKSRRQAGRGERPNKARNLTGEEEEEVLWKRTNLETKNRKH